MKQKLEILLVKDDTKECKKIIEHINNADDFKLVGATNDAYSALELISKFLPDAVVLDLELHNGRESGLTILQGMKEMTLSKIPYILVTTNNSSTILHEVIRGLGADFIMSKHQIDYSAKSVLDHLLLVRTAMLSKSDSFSMQETTDGTPEQFNNRIIRQIITELNNIGISPKHKGHKYLTEAIFIMVNQPVKNIYAPIAEKYGKSEPSVERAMQYSINKAWNTGSPDDLHKYYTARIDLSKGSPTIMEFVCFYANKIKHEY